MEADLLWIKCDGEYTHIKHRQRPHFRYTHLSEEEVIRRGCEHPMLDSVCGRPVEVVARFRRIDEDA